MKLIFLGAPGAGKGTMSELAKAEYKLAHISTGDMLREQIAKNTGLGLAAKGFIDKGELVPDEVILEMMADRLNQDDCINGFILDGFPRTLPQAEALYRKIDIEKCIEFDVLPETIITRLGGRRVCRDCGYVTHFDFVGESKVCPKCGGELYIRPDDNENTIRERIAVYTAQTAPLIDYYDKEGILLKIDANKDSKSVYQELTRALASIV